MAEGGNVDVEPEYQQEDLDYFVEQLTRTGRCPSDAASNPPRVSFMGDEVRVEKASTVHRPENHCWLGSSGERDHARRSEAFDANRRLSFAGNQTHTPVREARRLFAADFNAAGDEGTCRKPPAPYSSSDSPPPHPPFPFKETLATGMFNNPLDVNSLHIASSLGKVPELPRFSGKPGNGNVSFEVWRHEVLCLLEESFYPHHSILQGIR